MRKVPVAQVTTPKDGLHEILIDRWWPVTANDEVYFYGSDQHPFSSPQCNANKTLVERIAGNSIMTEAGGYTEIRQLPVVYVPRSINEYI